MRPERKICIELRDFLVRSHWEIKSFNPPGLQGGIILLDRSQKRGKGAIKPDIIAKKDDYVLIIEVKPKFYKSDIIKLDKINIHHVADLQVKLNLPEGWGQNFRDRLQKALGLGEFMSSEIPVPDEYLIFQAASQGIKLYFGEMSICTEVMF